MPSGSPTCCATAYCKPVLSPKPIRDVRDLLRSRKMVVQQRANEINRVQKVLETATIKLPSVASDVLGKSGRAMLE